MKKSFNIEELLHHKSKLHGTKPMHPSSLKAFQKHQEHDLKHLDLVDPTSTKQNKFIPIIRAFYAFESPLFYNHHNCEDNIKSSHLLWELVKVIF